MKVIYSGLQAENYNPDRNFAFEYANFYLSLRRLPGVKVIYYPYDPIVKIGKRKFNEELLALVKRERPDLFFAFMFTDELDRRVLDEIKAVTTSVAWFSDDHWRLWNYSRHYAPHFTWIVTTWSKAAERYRRYGITNVVRSQWACNTVVWKPVHTNRDIDVSFIGQFNFARARVIHGLRSAGINVWVRGWGWPEGRLSPEEVVKSISRSKINLNINVPPVRWRLKQLARLFFKRRIGKIVPDFWNVRDNFRSWRNMAITQIKARPFEILGCQAFLVSGFADDMDRYYEDKKEIAYYDGTLDDLVAKIRYYLPREEERERIAAAGYARTLHDHTYKRRFEDLFGKLKLSYGR